MIFGYVVVLHHYLWSGVSSVVDADVGSGIWAISISFVTGLWSRRLPSVPTIYDYVAFS